MSRDYIYICDSCNKCLFAFPESEHDIRQIVPCDTCGNELVLSELEPDVRDDKWSADEYGEIKDAFVCRGYF